ncbi:MAG TPA: fluoride efflux transporter CrcB [Acidobacteriaceae bacterium]
MTYLWVGAGGFLGAVARYALGAWVTRRLGLGFPYGTLAINLSGCFLLGLMLAVLDARMTLPSELRLLGPVGFVGAYTTFSTFEYETLRTVQGGESGLALLYVVLSVVVGYGAAWAGQATGRLVS